MDQKNERAMHDHLVRVTCASDAGQTCGCCLRRALTPQLPRHAQAPDRPDLLGQDARTLYRQRAYSLSRTVLTQ